MRNSQISQCHNCEPEWPQYIGGTPQQPFWYSGKHVKTKLTSVRSYIGRLKSINFNNKTTQRISNSLSDKVSNVSFQFSKRAERKDINRPIPHSGRIISRTGNGNKSLNKFIFMYPTIYEFYNFHEFHYYIIA